jgi:hypothetical protein
MLSGRCNLADGINAEMWYPLPNLQLSEEVRRIISVYFLTNLVFLCVTFILGIALLYS